MIGRSAPAARQSRIYSRPSWPSAKRKVDDRQVEGPAAKRIGRRIRLGVQIQLELGQGQLENPPEVGTLDQKEQSGVALAHDARKSVISRVLRAPKAGRQRTGSDGR